MVLVWVTLPVSVAVKYGYGGCCCCQICSQGKEQLGQAASEPAASAHHKVQQTQIVRAQLLGCTVLLSFWVCLAVPPIIPGQPPLRDVSLDVS